MAEVEHCEPLQLARGRGGPPNGLWNASLVQRQKAGVHMVAVADLLHKASAHKGPSEDRHAYCI